MICEYPGLGYLLLEIDKEIVLIRESPEPPDYQSKYPCLFVDKVDTFIIQKDERKERFVSFLVEQDLS